MDNEQLLKKVMNAKVDGRSARGTQCWAFGPNNIFYSILKGALDLGGWME